MLSKDEFTQKSHYLLQSFHVLGSSYPCVHGFWGTTRGRTALNAADGEKIHCSSWSPWNGDAEER